MKRKNVDDYWQYEIPDTVCREMFARAKAVLSNTYPKPGKVVSSVLTPSGGIFEGVNYHTDTYTATMHAEMAALAHAAIHGEKEIVAITGPNCHLCKQILWENSVRSKIDIMVIFEDGKKFKKIPLSSMMLYAWPDKKQEWGK